MTNVTILSIFRTHAQKEYRKVLEMKGTYILNILALLLFENLQRIYLDYRINGTQSKDVKWGVGVEGASFHGIVNDGSHWNLFWCFLCIFYYRNSPILKLLGQFENLGFVIMSTRENIRLIARTPFNILASFPMCVGWFESYLVKNPEQCFLSDTHISHFLNKQW